MFHRHHEEVAPVIDINMRRNMSPERRETLKQVVSYAGAQEDFYHEMRQDALHELGYIGAIGKIALDDTLDKE